MSESPALASPSAPVDASAAVVVFHSGRWPEAREALARLDAAGAAGPAHLAMLAWTHHKLGDDRSAEIVVNRALELDGQDPRVLLVKGDMLSALGAKREANLYYRALVSLAESGAAVPADLAPGVARARTLRDRLAAGIFDHLREELARAGYVEGRSSARFTHALDLATGRKQAYFQQPKAFYFPELPNAQFYPRDMFPWMDRVEAATDAITGELEALLEQDRGFSPYLQTVPHLPSRTDYPLVDSMDWSSCFLWKDGQATPNAARCPDTMAALAEAPLCQIAARSPQIMFSQLKAGAHILPHTGFVNTRLVCHLPLIAPPGCKFRVGNDVRSWEKGRAWVFDDTIEHEAINTSDRTRVVLIFDIWRPELNDEERVLVTAALEAMDAYSPTVAVWS